MKMLNVTLSYLEGIIATIREGGITVDLANDERPNTGFAVSRPDHEQKHCEHEFDVQSLFDYVFDHGTSLLKDRHYLGAWVESGEVYLDVSVVLTKQEDAARLAKLWGQIAYFDLATFTTHYVEQEG
jgi:hypothetical protein